MRKKYKRSLVIFAILIVFITGLIVFKYFNSEDTANIKVIDSIKDFSYSLDARDTNLLKENYESLKKVLNSNELDYNEYAQILAKLFIIDLFTIDNKLNKYDVGGVEYVYPDSLNNYKLNVQNTLYKTLQNNSNNKRNQDLPIVKEINASDVKNDTFKIGEESFESYVVELNWTYEKDLGYDNKATVTLVKKDNRVYVVEYKSGVNNE